MLCHIWKTSILKDFPLLGLKKELVMLLKIRLSKFVEIEYINNSHKN